VVDHLSRRAAVTVSRPLGAGSPDPLDLQAVQQLERNEAGRLELVRARAEKWIGGVSALGGVLGTVLVVKGRDSVENITWGWRLAAAIGLALALVALAYATYRAYQAAFGSPGTLAEIETVPLAGLHRRLIEARRLTADEALSHLAVAVKTAVFVAITLIAAAVGITFAPTVTRPSEKSVCVYDNGRLLVEVASPALAIRQMVQGTRVGPCP
jgi:hypothetical protein